MGGPSLFDSFGREEIEEERIFKKLILSKYSWFTMLC